MELCTPSANIDQTSAAPPPSPIAPVDMTDQSMPLMSKKRHKPDKVSKPSDGDVDNLDDSIEANIDEASGYAEETLDMQCSIINAIELLKNSLGAQACIINQMFIATPNTHYFKICDDVYVSISLKKFTGLSQDQVGKIVASKGGVLHSLKELMQKDYTSFN